MPISVDGRILLKNPGQTRSRRRLRLSDNWLGPRTNRKRNVTLSQALSRNDPSNGSVNESWLIGFRLARPPGGVQPPAISFSHSGPWKPGSVAASCTAGSRHGVRQLCHFGLDVSDLVWLVASSLSLLQAASPWRCCQVHPSLRRAFGDIAEMLIAPVYDMGHCVWLR